MSPSSTSEARKRRDAKATPPPEPLPGYVLCRYPEAVRAGWEVIDVRTAPDRAGDLSDGDIRWTPAVALDDCYADWLVIARPPRPRTVTIELPEDVAQRWADGPEGLLLTTDPAAVHDACRNALDGDK